MGGRPAIPDAVKLLRGKLRSGSLNRNAPNPRRVEPEMPAFLDKDARKEWRRLAPRMVQLGMLTEVDGLVFAGYCELLSEITRVNRQLKKFKGDFLVDKVVEVYEETDADGKAIRCERVEQKQNPLIVIKRNILNQIRLYCSEFGLTPSSRSKMIVPTGPQAVPDKDEEFLSGL
jgi:phage terminase small subunit